MLISDSSETCWSVSVRGEWTFSHMTNFWITDVLLVILIQIREMQTLFLSEEQVWDDGGSVGMDG